MLWIYRIVQGKSLHGSAVLKAGPGTKDDVMSLPLTLFLSKPKPAIMHSSSLIRTPKARIQASMLLSWLPRRQVAYKL